MDSLANKSMVILGQRGATFSFRAANLASRMLNLPKFDFDTGFVEVERNEDVLTALLERPGSYGIIAAETEVKGRLNESIESFSRLIEKYDNGNCPIQIIAAIRMQLSFVLMANKGVRKEDLSEISGHRQALAACRGNIAKLKCSAREMDSNSLAASSLRGPEKWSWRAALGPKEAALMYGLEVLDDTFEDAPATTTFFVLGPSSYRVSSSLSNRVLMVFRLRDGPLAFVSAIMPFGQVGLNLTYVHSFHNNSRTYDFLAEVQCDKAQIDNLHLALKVFGLTTLRSIVFGPFPVLHG